VLLIEDTHVTTFRVKAFLAGAMQFGDRLVVEDSFSKQHEIKRFHNMDAQSSLR
jgi:hypothetical protein